MPEPYDPCEALSEGDLPVMQRMNYCHGQMLAAQDFVDEQRYFLEKIALLTRCLHGYGVVCGLGVQSWKDDEGNVSLNVSSGVGIDAAGRELVHRNDCLPGEQKTREREWWGDSQTADDFETKRGSGHPFDVYVVIEYAKQPILPDYSPADPCCGDQRKFFRRWYEKPRIRLTWEGPPDSSAETCNPCRKAEDKRLWLAKLTFTGKKEDEPQIDNRIRRLLTRYEPTRIASINWLHTGLYEEGFAERLLRKGLTIDLTGSIDPKSIERHTARWTSYGTEREHPFKVEVNDIVEVSTISFGGATRTLQTTLVVEDRGDVPNSRLRIKLTQMSGISLGLHALQQVRVALHADFILDNCCRPLDAENRGGCVPLTGERGAIDEFSEKDKARLADSFQWTLDEYRERFRRLDSCKCDDDRRHPTSGTGAPGGDFLSWFYIYRDENSYDPSQE